MTGRLVRLYFLFHASASSVEIPWLGRQSLVSAGAWVEHGVNVDANSGEGLRGLCPTFMMKSFLGLVMRWSEGEVVIRSRCGVCS